MNDRIEIGVWTSISDGRNNIGAFLNRGELGIEAYDADDALIDVFADENPAFNAIDDCWDRKLQSNGGSPGAVVSEGPGLVPGPAQEGNGQLTHDKAMASTFLTNLDPTATRFTFQTFDDNKDRKSKALARVLHGTLDECFAELTRLNNLGAGIFVTISETNFLGRSAKNIVRSRALFSDADGEEQATHATAVIEAHDAIPSMTVSSGGGRHSYYICDDIPLERFSALQKSLALKLGTDRNVHDLPRVMRLPGTLHLKDPTTPRLVKLVATNCAAKIWKLSDLIDKLGLSATTPDRTNGGGAADGHKIEIAERFKGVELKNIAAGIVIEDYPPLPFAPIKEGCAWLREAYETGGKEFDEPQWNLTILASSFLENGHELAHKFGDQHPDYTFESTEKKFEEKQRAHETKNVGWPLCKTISDNGGEPHCKSCPHFSKGKSPLNLARPETKTPTTIRIVKGEIARVVDEAEDALLAVANAAPIMVRAGRLVQPIVDLLPASHGRKTEVVLLRTLTAANLIYLLNKHAATFEQYDGRSKKWLKVDPTPAIATQLLEKGRWQFPKVAGVINAPTLRPDGTILDTPGYDPTTQLWYHLDSQLMLPQLCAAPTRQQAEQALKLLTDLLTGFPFDNNVDRSVALAAILTPVLRGAFDVVPMNLLRAPDAGTGKSYLVDLISIIARGQLCPVVTSVKSAEEMEKRLGALVLEGASMVSLDNCSHDLGGDLLCQITERRLIYIRILGLSEMPACEWRGVLFATGINITYLIDMARRGLTANIDAKIERPELREFGFDPIERVLTDRGSYIAAAITIARAYITAGSPKVCGSLGSYEQWSRLVRSPLIWLGQEDPTKSMDEARAEDPVRRAERNLIAIWRTQLGAGDTYTAATLVTKANQSLAANHSRESGWAYPQLRELLSQQTGTPLGDIDVKKVGSWLTSIRGRVYDGHCIERVKESKGHGNTYALVKIQGAGAPTQPADELDRTLKELLSRSIG